MTDHSPTARRAPRAAVRLLAALGVALGVAPAAAHAQWGVRPTSYENLTEVYEWSGRVDREVRLELRGNRAYTDAVGSNEERGRSNGRLLRPIPRERGTLRIRRLDGRGSVTVIQQPTANNGYTAIVRLRDPSAGADRYRVAAYWDPADGVYGNDGRDARDRDGRYGRDGRGRDDRYEDGRYDARDRRDDDRYDRRGERRDDRYERRRDKRDEKRERREERRDRRRDRRDDDRRGRDGY